MSTDHALPRATTRERVKRKPEGRPPTNTWWRLALVAVTAVPVFVAAIAADKTMDAALPGLLALLYAQRAWQAWPHYRDGHRPTEAPHKVMAVVSDFFWWLTVAWMVSNVVIFVSDGTALRAAFTAYAAAWAVLFAEDRRLYRPGRWLRGRRHDPDEDGEP